MSHDFKSASSKTGIKHASLHFNKEDRRTDTGQQMTIPGKSNGFVRTLDNVKLKRVCKLLQNALGTLEEFKNPNTHGGGISKQEDKAPKPKPKSYPNLCVFPCGCGGCCLMRPVILYKVKYTPPKFKMKPLNPKTKCGNPHYGICLGRKKNSPIACVLFN